MMRRGALVAVLVSVGLVLAGCSGIPTSGQVQRSDVTVEPPAAEIEFLPASPVKGDSQEGILRGFIDAASSPQNDFGVARKFLSLTFAVEWDPNASVIIDDGAREFGRHQRDDHDDQHGCSVPTLMPLVATRSVTPKWKRHSTSRSSTKKVNGELHPHHRACFSSETRSIRFSASRCSTSSTRPSRFWCLTSGFFQPVHRPQHAS
jgi:hypothetical protein